MYPSACESAMATQLKNRWYIGFNPEIDFVAGENVTEKICLRNYVNGDKNGQECENAAGWWQ